MMLIEFWGPVYLLKIFTICCSPKKEEYAKYGTIFLIGCPKYSGCFCKTITKLTNYRVPSGLFAVHWTGPWNSRCWKGLKIKIGFFLLFNFLFLFWTLKCISTISKNQILTWSNSKNNSVAALVTFSDAFTYKLYCLRSHCDS